MTEKSLDNVKTYIRRCLKNAGINDGTLGYQIETVATDLLIYRKLREDMMKMESLLITEYSDKGQARSKIHPIVFELREQSKVVAKGLDLLMMNNKSKKGKADVAQAAMEGLMNMQIPEL